MLYIDSSLHWHRFSKLFGTVFDAGRHHVAVAARLQATAEV